MTISYSAEVPNGSNFGCFWPVLFKWRGSVYKLIWRELLAYLCVYYTLNLTYRYGLTEDGRRVFERIRNYCGQQQGTVQLSFVLGFYVTLVVHRWWNQYRLLPWPDTLALFVNAAIQGHDEIGRLMRRNIMRYMVLAYVITLQKVSLRVKRRFPTWQHLVDAGLMLENERKIFEKLDLGSPMSKYWMPLVWATNIINRARKEELIPSDHIVQTLLMELSDIRRRLGQIFSYNTVCVPLVYTQVATLVLYSYLAAAVMGSQMIPTYDEKTRTYTELDVYFPLFAILQFVFYVGWLKVAEVIINPFGEDDDDFELNWLIDRHIKASYMIVDEMHNEHPELLKDQYWDEVVPKELPYTVASEHYRREEPKGSAEHYVVKESEAVYANIGGEKRSRNEEVYADYESVDTPMIERRKGWFGRQMTSMRSSSTAYSSGGLSSHNRQNSVYSSPDAELTKPITTGDQPLQKLSLYDKFVNRKSVRNRRQIMKQNSKISRNGSLISNVPPKARPRIPTPDVTKDTKVHPLSGITTHSVQLEKTSNIASGVALMATQLANNPSIYPASAATTLNSNDLPVVGTLLLTPIKELDSSLGSNTLHAGQSATAALAKSILPPTIKRPVSSYVKDGQTSSIGKAGSCSTDTVIMIPITNTVSSNSTDSGPVTVATASDAIPISVTSIPLAFTAEPANTGSFITELPCDDSVGITTMTLNDGKKSPNSKASSSATSTLSKRKPEHSEVYV
ncbi:bestrophin-2-like [Sabethes cyaneus]|uniref:bestrophin-2-like n=1 Tax=Sabethes cyaneus TaxID=53552 RepID=UPI00237E39E3|nr:bestrophin-2-like [Sabethes cyaneus]